MMQTMSDRNWATVTEFVTDLSRLRTRHKQEWIAFQGNVCGKQVKIKSYALWIQILEVNGIRHDGYCETVTTWKNTITNALAYESPVAQNVTHN